MQWRNRIPTRSLSKHGIVRNWRSRPELRLQLILINGLLPSRDQEPDHSQDRSWGFTSLFVYMLFTTWDKISFLNQSLNSALKVENQCEFSIFILKSKPAIPVHVHWSGVSVNPDLMNQALGFIFIFLGRLQDWGAGRTGKFPRDPLKQAVLSRSWFRSVRFGGSSIVPLNFIPLAATLAMWPWSLNED